MMRKILFLLVILAIAPTLFGCRYNEENQLSAMDESLPENHEEELLDYTVEQIVLSKGFQFIDSNVEIIENNKNLKVLVNIGLIESSGIAIDKVSKTSNTINIYINRLLEQDEVQLAVPQVTLNIEDPLIENLKDPTFNVIAENYELVSLKFNRNQILSKINNKFNIGSNTIPDVELTKSGDEMFWDISFNNILNRENSRSPLFNLQVKADALTGEILDSEKDTVSTYIDKGQLLDYIPNSYLLYKQKHTEDDIVYESLWTYDVNTHNRNKLYTTKYQIQSALFSPNGEYISLIEVDESESDIYLIQRSDEIAYKATPINYLRPQLMKWKDNENFYFINITDETSTLFTYNIDENKSNIEFSLDKVIESFDILDKKLVFTEPSEYDLNKNIFLTEDGQQLDEIGLGFKPVFLNNENITYLKNIEEENKNILEIYNIEKNILHDEPNYNIENYYHLNDENLMLIEKTTHNNEYMLSKYNFIDNLIEPISKINSKDIFYNLNENNAYITLSIPYEDDNINNIYSMNLTKLK